MPRPSRSRSPLRHRPASYDEESRSIRRNRDRNFEDERDGRQYRRHDDTRNHIGDKDGERRRERDRHRERDGDRDRDRMREQERAGREDSGRRDSARRDFNGGQVRDQPREGERERDRDGRRDIERRPDRHRDADRDRTGPSHRSASPPSRRSPPPSQPASHSPSRSQSPRSKAKPNFAPSGLLAAATNTVKAVDGTSTVLKYNEPPEARKPVLGWRLYVFKGSEQVELLHIQRQSAYLIGRDRLVADIAIDHPSCSKQHAVIQYRYVQEKNEFGESKGVVKPFIIDLESTNGTHVNDETVPVSRYYELKAGDVIKFGQSTREYVILHDEAS